MATYIREARHAAGVGWPVTSHTFGETAATIWHGSGLLTDRQNAELVCLAGVAPSTRRSGKVKIVNFRWAADKQRRDAVCDFAGDSRRASPWATQLYQRARARGHDHPHAVRILARAWLQVMDNAGRPTPITTPPATAPPKPSPGIDK